MGQGEGTRRLLLQAEHTTHGECKNWRPRDMATMEDLVHLETLHYMEPGYRLTQLRFLRVQVMHRALPTDSREAEGMPYHTHTALLLASSSETALAGSGAQQPQDT